MRGVLTRALAAVLVGGALVVVAPALTPPAAATDCFDINSRDDDNPTPVETQGPPVDALQVGAAQQAVRDRTGKGPGEGVRVGVIDSGVEAAGIADTDTSPPIYQTKETEPGPVWHQGTAVAGLISGDRTGGDVVGVAPEAEVVDIRVYDAPGESDDLVDVSPDNLVRGLERAADEGLDVVNVSLTVGPSRELERAVRAVVRSGAVLVAASGDVPAEEGGPFEDIAEGGPGEDGAQEIFPAGYATKIPGVVAVSSTVADGVEPRDFLLPNSATTVVAPTEGAVSYGVIDERCTLPEPSSVYAAATVSGVLALLATVYPRETPQQLVARLVDTAAGSAVSPDPAVAHRFSGHGVVQPLEALERVVDPRPRGGVPRLEQPEPSNEPAAMDPPDPDLLAAAREDAVWWALGAGGLIAVLLLLRPVVGRRRRGG